MSRQRHCGRTRAWGDTVSVIFSDVTDPGFVRTVFFCIFLYCSHNIWMIWSGLFWGVLSKSKIPAQFKVFNAVAWVIDGASCIEKWPFWNIQEPASKKLGKIDCCTTFRRMQTPRDNLPRWPGPEMSNSLLFSFGHGKKTKGIPCRKRSLNGAEFLASRKGTSGCLAWQFCKLRGFWLRIISAEVWQGVVCSWWCWDMNLHGQREVRNADDFKPLEGVRFWGTWSNL